jgi:hypothetical protein
MTDPVSGSVRIGTYALEVGTLTESYAAFEPKREHQNVTTLHDALAEEAGEVHTPVAALEKVQANAETLTRNCERAHELFRASAEGRLLEADAVMAEVDSLLGLAERLHRDGRFNEELRLLRALHGLLVLAHRWLDLIRALRRALSAAGRAVDHAEQAWVRHELGSLHLCAGEPEAAAVHLRQALRLQQRLGQANGTCATRHNLDSAERDIATRATVVPSSRRLLRLAGVVGIVALVAGGGTAIALAQGDDPRSPAGATAPTASDSTGSDPATPTTGTSQTPGATTTSTPETIDATAPAVALVTPSDGSIIRTGTPEFSGTAGVEPGDDPEVLVEIVGESAGVATESPLRAPVVEGAWTVTPTVALPDGSYQATARQSDGEGNTGSSATVTLTVDTVAPDLTLVCPGSFNSLTIRCTLTSTDAGTASFKLTEIRFRSRDETEFKLSATNAKETVELQPGAALEVDLTLPKDDFEDDGASRRWAFLVEAVQSDAAGNSGSSDPVRTDFNPVT